MDFSFTEEQNRFRLEVHNFLEEEIQKGIGNPPMMPGYKASTVLTPTVY